VGDDQTDLLVGRTDSSLVNQVLHPSVYLEVALLHSKTVPRSSGERPKSSFLVVRESFIEAFGAFREPALREEAVGVYEVVRRMVSGEMRHADANL
jgi:hypothetical protein